MSEESATRDVVELSRQAFEALIRRDFDAFERFYAPDAVLRGAEIGTFTGPRAIRRLLEDMISAFTEFDAEREGEIVDLGNGVVFSEITWNARPSATSGLIQTRVANVLVWTEGQIERQTNSADIDEARADAERLAQERG